MSACKIPITSPVAIIYLYWHHKSLCPFLKQMNQFLDLYFAQLLLYYLLNHVIIMYSILSHCWFKTDCIVASMVASELKQTVIIEIVKRNDSTFKF